MTDFLTTPTDASVRTLPSRDWTLTAAAPIVAAVDGSPASGAVIAEALRLGRDLAAPVIFVYVRRDSARFLDGSVSQRQLTRDMAAARQVIDEALVEAGRARVDAEAEILEGHPQERIVTFARDRNARLLVVGRRARRFRRSISRGVIAAARLPVVIVQEHDPP